MVLFERLAVGHGNLHSVVSCCFLPRSGLVLRAQTRTRGSARTGLRPNEDFPQQPRRAAKSTCIRIVRHRRALRVDDEEAAESAAARGNLIDYVADSGARTRKDLDAGTARRY